MLTLLREGLTSCEVLNLDGVSTPWCAALLLLSETTALLLVAILGLLSGTTACKLPPFLGEGISLPPPLPCVVLPVDTM